MLSRQHTLSHSSHVQIVQGATQDYAASWTRAEPEPIEPPESKPQAPIKEELGMPFLQLLTAWTDPELYQQGFTRVNSTTAVLPLLCAIIIMQAAHRATLWVFSLCIDDTLMILFSLVQHGASRHTIHPHYVGLWNKPSQVALCYGSHSQSKMS